MLLAQAGTRHINTVAHEGKVLIVATVAADGITKLCYTVKQDGFEDSALQHPDGSGWDAFKALALPNDSVGDASVTASEKEELTYQQGKYLLRSIYKSADLTADAPVQLVSHDGHVYIFRQSTRGTLLVDRFVLDGMTNTLVPKLEVRFKRSRQRYQPIKATKISSGGQLESVDSLDFRDMRNEPFYEPTSELCPDILNQLEHGAFGVVVTPTNEQDSYRWHIFAYNRTSKKVDLLTLRAGSEQIFDVRDYWFRTVHPVTELARYDSIPGVIRRELKLEDSAGKPLAITNGLAVVRYDVQREQQTQHGPQLMRETSKILLAVPTEQGLATLSFAIAADGRLAQIAKETKDTPLRSQEREVLLPLNLLDNIRPVGDASPAPGGAIVGMSRATDDGSADRLRIQVGNQDKTALKRLKHGDVIKLSNTTSYDGLYRVGVVSNGSFVIDARFKYGEVGDWEKVEHEDTGLVFDGLVTKYEKSSDGKLTVHATNHGLAAGDLVQIVGCSAYDGEYPIIKHDESSFTIQRLWLNGEAVNIKLESYKRRGIICDGKQDWIEAPLSNGLKLSVGFAFEAWVKLNSAADQTLIATGPAPFNLTGAANGGWQAVLGVAHGKFSFVLDPFVPNVRSIRLESTSTATLRQWVHVACVFDGKALHLLENGEIKGSLAVAELHKRAQDAHDDLVKALTEEQNRQEAALRQTTLPPNHPTNYDAGRLIARTSRHALSGGAGDLLVLTAPGEPMEQRWQIEADGTNVVIRNLANNHVLDENGRLSVWHQLDSQRWELAATPDGYYTLRSKSRGMVLEAQQGRVQLATQRPVGMQTTWPQLWTFAPLGESKVDRARTALKAVKTLPPQQDAPIVISTQTLTLGAKAKATSALGQLKTLGAYLQGEVADVRVWNTRRTPTEISNTMYLRLTGREAGLAGYWRLGGVVSEAGSTRVFDFSANANHGLTHGAPYAGGITLGRTLRDGKTEAVKFSNGDLVAVREGATYVESFEFRTDKQVDPANADGKAGALFKPSLWGCLSRGTTDRQPITPMQENFQFEDVGEGWRRASCRLLIPQGVRLLRCFEVADVRGVWGTLEVRRHMLKLVSNTVTESSVAESARLNTLAGLSITGLEQVRAEVQRLLKEEADCKTAYDAEVANPLNYWCRIVSKHTGKCIYIAGPSTADGALALQWEWHTSNADGDHGRWKVERLADGCYKLAVKNSMKVLCVSQAATADGAQLVQSTDGPANPIGDHGIWKLEPTAGGYYVIVAKHTGKCVELFSGNPANGAQIGQSARNGTDFQLWKFERVGDPINTKIQDAQTLWDAKKKELAAAQARLTAAPTTLDSLRTRQHELIAKRPPLEARFNTLYADLFGLSNLNQLRRDRDAQQVRVDQLTGEERKLKTVYDTEAANPLNYWCQIIAKHSGKYIMVYTIQGMQLAVQIKWDPATERDYLPLTTWTFAPLGDGCFRPTNRALKTSLFVDAASHNEGAVLLSAAPSDPQGDHGRWRFEDAGNGYVRIVVKHSGKCLEVNGAGTADKALIVQSTWQGRDNQRWKLERIGEAANSTIADAKKLWETKRDELLQAQAELDRLNKLLNQGQASQTELDNVRADLAKVETELADVTRQLAPLLQPAEALGQLDLLEREEAALITRQKELQRLLSNAQNRAATEASQQQQQALIDRLRGEEGTLKSQSEAEVVNPLNYWCKLFANEADTLLTVDQNNSGVVLHAPGDAGDIQRWKFEPVGGEYYRIVNKKTNTCLGGYVYGRGYTQMHHRSWSESDEQRWKLGSWGSGHYRFDRKNDYGPAMGLAAARGGSELSLMPFSTPQQRWRLERVGEPINTKARDAHQALLDKQNELRIAIAKLDELNKAVAANQQQVQLWETELKDIVARLPKLLTRITTLSSAYLATIVKATTTAQAMPDLPNQHDPRGLKVQGALLAAQPATRLHAVESCAGRVIVSYQDRDSYLRQSQYDSAYDADGKGEEWLPDTQRAGLAFDGKTAVALPASLFSGLNNQITIEFWARGGNDLPKDTFLLGVNDTANNPCLSIQLPNQNGEVVWTAGLQSGATPIDSLKRLAEARFYRERWTHWAFVKAGDKGEMRIYINGMLWHKNEPKATDGSDLLRQPLGTTGAGLLGNRPGQKLYWQGQIAELRIWNMALGERELETNSLLTLSGNEPGLVAYYPFNEATGEIARDQTGRGQTLTITGCSWVPCTAPIGSLPGMPRRLLDQLTTFDDKTTFVQLPALSLDLSAGLTLATRVKFDDLSKPSTLIHLGNGADGGNILLANEGSGNTSLVFRISNRTTPVELSCANAIKAGEWLEIAATIEQNGMARLYLNGEEKATGTLPLPLDVLRTKNVIGKHNTTGDGLFKGQLAYVQLWTTARSAAQIKQIRQSGSVASSLISAEYSRVRVDAQQRKTAIMLRCLALPSPDGVRLLDEQRIEELDLKWIGNTQIKPTLVGYIEGAPPLPTENLTEAADYNGATSVALIQSSGVEYSWTRQQDVSLGGKLGIFVGEDTKVTAGVGIEKEVLAARTGVNAELGLAYHWQNASTVKAGHTLKTSDRLALRGSREQQASFVHLGQRFIPKNIGYALVISGLADVFVSLLKRSGRMVGYQVLPVEGVPLDVNTITFMINPAYTMAGSLDGMTGIHATSNRFFRHVPEMRSQYGSLYPASYFRLKEAYDLKQQIDRQDELHQSYFNQFNAGLVDEASLNRQVGDTRADGGSTTLQGMGDIGASSDADKQLAAQITAQEKKVKDLKDRSAPEAEIKAAEKELNRLQDQQLKRHEQSQDKRKQEGKQRQEQIKQRHTDLSARAHASESFAGWQRKMENLQIRAGKRNIVNTYVWDGDGGFHIEEQQFASTVEHSIGGSFDLNFGFGGQLAFRVVGLGVDLNLMATVSMTQTMSKTETSSKAMELQVDLSGVESRGITDHRDYPTLPGEKVDRYRFMSFYLENNSNHWHDFFNQVVDPEWLASNDEEARALRQTQNAAPNKVWRVLHRVTYVERPALMGFGRSLTSRTKEAADIQELRRQVHELTALQKEISSKLDRLLTVQTEPTKQGGSA